MNILFLVPYPLNESPSQRFRFEQYFAVLKQQGHSFQVEPFLEPKTWRRFYDSGRAFSKSLMLVKGLLRRLFILPALFKFDFVFIHREVAPLGPPVFEWLITKVFRKKVIYDFDDALWLTDRIDEGLLLKGIKWRSKIKTICRWSYKVSCGNEYLCSYARRYNDQVIYNPTTIDTEVLHNPDRLSKSRSDAVTVGWTGSHSTLKYLSLIEHILQDIERDFPTVQFLVIADKKPDLNLKSLRYKPWRIDTEIEDLFEFDIGIMPLPDDEWTKGKCAFKALQYMALQIPTIASPVGVNSAVIDHGLNGFLAASPAEWKNCLKLLIDGKNLRTEFGKMGRKKVAHQYSVLSNKAAFLSLFG